MQDFVMEIDGEKWAYSSKENNVTTPNLWIFGFGVVLSKTTVTVDSSILTEDFQLMPIVKLAEDEISEDDIKEAVIATLVLLRHYHPLALTEKGPDK